MAARIPLMLADQVCASRPEVVQLHFRRLDPQKVVKQYKAHNRLGLVGPGLPAYPGAGGAVKIFSPLLAG